MNLTNLTKIALKALNNNKLRCFLTMLGIIIGVASVITMLAIGQGSKRSIREQISEMGSNMIMIHPGNMERGGVRQDASSMQTLKLNDYKSISEQAEYVSACSPSVNSSGQFIYGANNYPSTIYGITEDYLDIRKISFGRGKHVHSTRRHHFCQSLFNRENHYRQSLPQWRKPDRKSNPVQ